MAIGLVPAANIVKMRFTMAASAGLIARSPRMGSPRSSKRRMNVIAVTQATSRLASFDPAALSSVGLLG